MISKRKSKLILLVLAIFVVQSLNPSLSTNATVLDLEDEAKNEWFFIKATASTNGTLNISWDSVDSSTNVQITGDLPHTINGGATGNETLKLDTIDSRIDINLDASRILWSDKAGAPLSEPKIDHYLKSLVIDNPGYSEPLFGVSPAAASGAAAKTYLRYQTFIPLDYVTAPPGFCTPDASKDYVFAGDARGFDPASSSVRTRFQVAIDWTSNGDASLIRYVGATKRYPLVSGLPDKSSEDTLTASATGMIFTSYSNSSTLVHFKLSHSVTNPMCQEWVTFPIWYTADVWIARSGAYTINLETRRAPNHELYIKDSDQSNWKTLLQDSTYSRDCFNKFWGTQLLCSGPSYSPSGNSR